MSPRRSIYLLEGIKMGHAPDEQLVAMYDRQRKGVFIHRALLEESPFTIGDRFAIRKGKQAFFSVTIVKDDRGKMVFDRHGLFVPRTRRFDILIGGIFDAYVVEIEPVHPDTIRIKPLAIVQKGSPL